jgi:dipeptidase D
MSVLDSNVSVFRFFEEISKIPRGSYQEDKIADYLVEFAKSRKLKYVKDKMNNVIIYKDGSSLYQGHDPLMLQAHIDMVCEKNNDVEHDFENDPLDLYVEDGFLKARGTTLGADDGCGVAIMLALLDDKNAKHPPLECVFTVQEEVGLFGAAGFDESLIKARRMIGLDSENEHEVTTTSSGGKRVTLTKDFYYEENKDQAFVLSIKGLEGGHSGSEIDKEKGNANILLIRLLHLLVKNDIDVRLIDINGGLKSNAIAREATVMFASSNDQRSIEVVLENAFLALRAQYRKQEPHLSIELKKAESHFAMNSSDSEAIINTVFLSPNGMMAKSCEIPGLTLISLNCGVIKTLENKVEVLYSLRSPIKGAIDDLSDKLETIAYVYGLSYKEDAVYGGWAYDPKSKIRFEMKKFFKNEYGIDLKENATHGGLETGIFKSKIPDLDIVTYGPNMSGIHSPDEKLDIQSFLRVYERLKDFIETL